MSPHGGANAIVPDKPHPYAKLCALDSRVVSCNLHGGGMDRIKRIGPGVPKYAVHNASAASLHGTTIPRVSIVHRDTGGYRHVASRVRAADYPRHPSPGCAPDPANDLEMAKRRTRHPDGPRLIFSYSLWGFLSQNQKGAMGGQVIGWSCGSFLGASRVSPSRNQAFQQPPTPEAEFRVKYNLAIDDGGLKTSDGNWL